MTRYWIAGLLLALHLNASAQTCVATTPVQPVISPGKCAQGYTLQYGVLGEECIDNYSRAQDAAVLETGISYRRDGHGNVQSVWKRDPATGQFSDHAAEFGGHDEFGRPGWYFERDGVVVALEWPAGGACLPSSMTSFGWRSDLTWSDSERVQSIVTPLLSRRASYLFNWYPQGGLHMQTADLPISNARLQITRAFDEDGGQSGGSYKFLPAEPTTSAALAPGAAPPEPRLQPKVVVRPVAGVPLGARLLGPLSLLYPLFDLLGQQIGRFYANAMASSDQTLNDSCAAQMRGDYAACRKFWSDLGLDPENLPTDDLKVAHLRCTQSARERQKDCMAGVVPPLLNIPDRDRVVGNQAHLDCYKLHASDKEACRQATQAKYAGSGGAYPTLYALDLYGCILSAQRRLAQCQAGQPLSVLEFPK